MPEADEITGGGYSTNAFLAATLGTVSDNPRVDALLERQIALSDLQIENLKKQDEYETSHLRWRRFNDQMRGALQVMVVTIGLLIVAGIGAAVWNAASDKGLVIDAFSVPPDLAAKGLTGEVLANKVLDKLTEFQVQTGSGRASASYANNWGGDIKVQIPNTGVSISEFNRALHQWLGRETHINGEVYRTPTGIAMSARAASQSTPIVKGSEADTDMLVGKIAENIYRATQPYRYAAWLSAEGRTAESSQALLALIATSRDPMEQGWAYNGMAHNTIITGADTAANAWLRKAIAADPSLLLPRSNLVSGEMLLGHDESAVAVARDLSKVATAGDPTMGEPYFSQNVLQASFSEMQLRSDGASALEIAKKQLSIDVENGRENAVVACSMLHDIACFRTAVASWEPTTDNGVRGVRLSVLQIANALLGRWDALIAAAPAFHDALEHGPAINRSLWSYDAPLAALAAAHLGDLKRARRLAASLPDDCVVCLLARARIETARQNWRGAGWWFARAEAAAPSIARIDADWGAVLLAKGDTAGAVAKFESANKKAPHFADPLEMWGEALVLQNRSGLALAKFEEANRYAPKWSRLHLKWGEALLYAGKRVEAQKQFALVSLLRPTSAEKSERSTMKAKYGV